MLDRLGERFRRRRGEGAAEGRVGLRLVGRRRCVGVRVGVRLGLELLGLAGLCRLVDGGCGPAFEHVLAGVLEVVALARAPRAVVGGSLPVVHSVVLSQVSSGP